MDKYVSEWLQDLVAYYAAVVITRLSAVECGKNLAVSISHFHSWTLFLDRVDALFVAAGAVQGTEKGACGDIL